MTKTTSSSQQTFSRALPVLAAIYGGRFGVSVSVSGNVAFSDQESIHLPAMSVTEKTKAAFLGYLCHESAHIRWTDWKELSRARDHSQKQFGPDVGNYFREMQNVLEDIRVDARMIGFYPGTVLDTEALEALLIREGKVNCPPPGSDRFTASLTYAYFAGRMKLAFLEHKDNLSETRRILIDACDEKIADLIDQCVASIGPSTTTKDIDTMTFRILRAVLGAKPSKPPQKAANPRGRSQSPQTGSGSGKKGSGGTSAASGGSSSGSNPADVKSQGANPGENGKAEGGAKSSGNAADGACDGKSASAGEGAGDGSASQEADSSAGAGKSGASSSSESGTSGSAGSDSSGSGKSGSASSSSAGSSGNEEAGQPSGKRGKLSDRDLMAGLSDEELQNLKSAKSSAESSAAACVLTQVAREENSKLKKTGAEEPSLPNIWMPEGYRRIRSYLCDGTFEDLVAKMSAGLEKTLRERVWSLGRADRFRPKGRSIDLRRIGRLLSGDLRVFRHAEPEIRPETAIHVLCDTSSSVDRNLMYYQASAAASLLSVLAKLGKFSVGLTWFDDMVYPQILHDKPFTPKCIEEMREVPGGNGTLIESAVLHGINSLVDTKKKRRILVLITDGTETPGGQWPVLEALMKEYGIELYALGFDGVEEKRLKQWTKHAAVVEEPESFSYVLTDLLKNRLVEYFNT